MDWNDVYEELAANGYPLSEREREHLVFNFDMQHTHSMDDVEWLAEPTSHTFISVKFDWSRQPMMFKKLMSLPEHLIVEADVDGTLLEYAAYNGLLYKLMSIAERLARRNAIIYGSGGYREYRASVRYYPVRSGVYCGSCHRETPTISGPCSCAPRRAWREWDRHHDQVALQHMWSVGQWPLDAHTIAYNSYGWSHDRWVQTFKSIMTAYLKLNRGEYADMVNEYITEAEHGDGDEYWLEFKHPRDVVADFDLYSSNVMESRASS